MFCDGSARGMTSVLKGVRGVGAVMAVLAATVSAQAGILLDATASVAVEGNGIYFLDPEGHNAEAKFQADVTFSGDTPIVSNGTLLTHSDFTTQTVSSPPLSSVAVGDPVLLHADASRASDPAKSINAVAEAQSKAEFGLLHSLLRADIDSLVGGGTVAARASTHAEWDDVLKIVAPTIANGTFVKVEATVEVEFTVTGDATWDWSLAMPLLGTFPVLSANSTNTTNGTHLFQISKMLDLQVGSTLTPFQAINANINASGANGASRSGELNVANTVHTYFTPQTPGVSIESGGGGTYAPVAAATVPEPATLTLFGFGAAGLFVMGGYKKKRPVLASRA